MGSSNLLPDSVERSAMTVSARLRAYFRRQHLALLALFLVLTGGSAYALTGSNTVFSDDVVNNEVKAADVATDAVGAGELAAGSVGTSELTDNGARSTDVRDDILAGGGLAAADLGPGSVGASEVADGSLSGAEFAPDSLGGADIDEPSLGPVPSATLAGLGRFANPGSCDPSDGAYIDCGSVTLNLPEQTNVLVTAAGRAFGDDGFCRLATSLGGVDPTYVYIDEGTVALTAVLGPVGPGSVDFGVECQQNGPEDIEYFNLKISAVGLSPN
jgi:hypothetical protein